MTSQAPPRASPTGANKRTHLLWPIEGPVGRGAAPANLVPVLPLRPLQPLPALTPRPSAWRRSADQALPMVRGVTLLQCRARWRGCKWHGLWTNVCPVASGLPDSPSSSCLRQKDKYTLTPIGKPGSICLSGARRQRSRACSRALLGPPMGPPLELRPRGPCPGSPRRATPAVRTGPGTADPAGPARASRDDEVPLSRTPAQAGELAGPLQPAALRLWFPGGWGARPEPGPVRDLPGVQIRTRKWTVGPARPVPLGGLMPQRYPASREGTRCSARVGAVRLAHGRSSAAR